MSTKTSKSRAEVNATILKSLLKLPGNKFCCDCKTADHPRWASWNLGIFLCIRCSGIHRSMGTHISRVKSVDLDAWTDEQTQSMVKWGNKKANSYWESKLDQEHVPSEGKIDNFVKTKYVSRRWISQENRPDPDDLSDDESIPIKSPQAVQNVPPPSRQQKSPSSSRTQPAAQVPAKQPTIQPIDSLLGMDFAHPVASVAPQDTQQTSATPAIIPQHTNQSNLSLLSDTTPSVQSQQTQNTGRTNVPPRNDLKMSIMSLYASAPKPQQYAQAQAQPQRNISLSSASTSQKSASAFDDLNGLFGGMNVQAAASRPQRVVSGANVMPTAQPAASKQSQFSQNSQSSEASRPAANPWSTDEDTWGGFQSESTAKPAASQSSAFDNLYSTSDVWK